MNRIFTLALSVLLFQSLAIAQVEQHSFVYDGELREYIVFLPQSYGFLPEMPVVINFHGYEHTAEGQMEFTGMNDIADTAGFIIVYPQAVDGIWNSGIDDNPNWPAPDSDDVGFVNALIDTLAMQYTIDLNRVYACGISNGGFMTLKLACQLGDRFAAFAPVAAVNSVSTISFCMAQPPAPILFMHGTEDGIVPFSGAEGWYPVEETIDFWAELNACIAPDTTMLPDTDPSDGCTVMKINYEACDENSGLVFYKILNGGHTWPGSTYTFPPAVVGNTNYDINAGVEIWNFLKNYELDQATAVADPAAHDIFLQLSAYPNPFRGSLNITYELLQTSMVSLKIYNNLGQEVAILVQKAQKAGKQVVVWNASGLPRGIYICRLQAGNNETLVYNLYLFSQ